MNLQDIDWPEFGLQDDVRPALNALIQAGRPAGSTSTRPLTVSTTSSSLAAAVWARAGSAAHDNSPEINPKKIHR